MFHSLPSFAFRRRTALTVLVGALFIATVAEAAVGPTERPESLPALIKDALAHGEKRIVLPPGRYRVAPEKRAHLSFVGLKDIEIIANGVEMICTETTRAITVEKCENFTIRGLTIDYDPLPYTQGRITKLADDRSSMEVQLLGGYPSTGFKTGNVEIFDPITQRVRGRITYFQTAVEPGESGLVKLIKTEPNPKTATEQIGDIAVFPAVTAPGGALPHAVYSEDSHRITFENVTVLASPTFGFLENRCDGSHYIGCRVDRRPPATDLARREVPRMRSTNADAYHSKNAVHGPLIEKCTAHFMGDDCVAINGDFHFISHADGAALRVLAKNDLTIQVGDTVQILTYDGVRLPDAKVLSIAPDGEIQPDERAFLLAQKMDVNTRTNMMKKAFTITLNRPVDAPRGAAICSADRIGNGFIVRDCQLGMNRSRGIIVKAGRGEIRNNTIEGSVMESILISPEYWWMEAGMADNLTIEGNRIIDSGGIGITIRAQCGTGNIAPAGAFQNITLRNNTITGCPLPGILVTSVKGLVLQGNQITLDRKKVLDPWEIGPGFTGKPKPLMLLNCADVRQ